MLEIKTVYSHQHNTIARVMNKTFVESVIILLQDIFGWELSTSSSVLDFNVKIMKYDYTTYFNVYTSLTTADRTKLEAALNAIRAQCHPADVEWKLLNV